MNNEVNLKLEEVEKILNNQQRRYKRNMIITITCYVVLVVFVVSYTTFLMSRLKQLATPETVAELIAMRVKGQMPAIKAYVAENTKEYAVVAANQTVDYVHSSLPTLGSLIKDQMDTFTAAINNRLTTKYVPALNEYFALHKDTALQSLDKLSNEEIAKQLSKNLMEVYNQEMDIACSNLGTDGDRLRKDIDAITKKPDSQLTKREYSEKKFLLYWMFLVKYGETGKP